MAQVSNQARKMLTSTLQNLEKPALAQALASGILDTCSMLKLCEIGKSDKKSDQSIEGFTPYVTSKVLTELNNLLSSAKRENFRRPYFLLKKLKIINENRRDIKEEAFRLYQTHSLDSKNKIHNCDDSDWFLVAAAKIENQPIITEDRKLQQMAEEEGIYAAPVSVLRNLIKRAKKINDRIQQSHYQPDINKPELVKCLLCGMKVESGPAYHAHLVEKHSLGKAKKPENLHKKTIKKDKKSKHMKRVFFRVISYTACTNVNIKDPENVDGGHCNNQVKVTQSSNEIVPQPNEMALAETQRKEDGEIVRIYRPLGDA